jgi:8-oxo-dGTP pyrophosphatase MutT (NUDIX family)
MSTVLLPFAAGVLIIENGLILAIERDDGRLGFPCGKIEPGETPAQAAVRECREETGCEVRLLDYIRPPYVGLDVVDQNMVSLHRARILKRGRPTTPGEGSPVWVTSGRLLTATYADYNLAAFKHFEVRF